jgi:hypothetical protein
MSEIVLKPWKSTEVRCLAGYRANERPISFLEEERRIGIRTILDSWREPDYVCFKVETEDSRVYDLRYHEHDDYWQVRELVKRG